MAREYPFPRYHHFMIRASINDIGIYTVYSISNNKENIDNSIFRSVEFYSVTD